MDEILSTVKKALRFTHDALDDDIKRNITAARDDMERAGVSSDESNTELYIQCVIFYCKWIYNFIDKGDDYLKAYERLRDALSLDSKYRSG